MPRPRGGCWPWHWCLRALIGRARRRAAGWTDKPFVTGFIAITPRVWRVFRTAGRARAFHALILRRWRNSRPSVEAGPDPERDGVVRWRRSDLARRIALTFGVEVHERTVGTYLATLGYRRLQVAPAAPENRSTRPRGFQKNFGAAVAAAIPQAAQGKPVEVWFQE